MENRDSRKVTGRRSLRFQSLEDIVSDLDGLEGRPLKALGNWSVGQLLKHCAIVMEGGIDGLSIPAPWYIRWIARLFKNFMLNGRMPPGIKLPDSAAEKLIPGPTTEAEGFAALRHAIHRMQTETYRAPSPILGPLTIEESTKINCRHCELHLSFIVPVENAVPSVSTAAVPG